jgi:PelA/Pel-15E family pectate lyase
MMRVVAFSLSFFTAIGTVAAQTPAVPPASPPWGGAVLRQSPEWYATAEARALANSVLLYQSLHGAWPKNTDLSRSPVTPEIVAEIERTGSADTIDNGATITPMRFLALVFEATKEDKYREAFERGLDYLFKAQYENGGWPQFFPLRKGYYSHITFNDDAMVNVLTLIRDVADGKKPYAFIGEVKKAKARDALARGVDVILRTQIKRDGKLTAWCAQHDEKTLQPAWARAYELPSLSGNESVGIARFLMEVDRPTPEIVAAVEGAVNWMRSVAIPGIRIEEFTGADGKRDRRVVADPSAAPMWARFYDLGTDRPVFLGRDSVVHYALSEIEHERRNGYAYYGVWPSALLAKDYPRWRARLSN